MIDRGADVAFLSQYPYEREILFAPLTGLEVQSTRIEGSLLVIEVRLSVNLQALTIEQVIGKRRKLLSEMADQMQLDVRQQLGAALCEEELVRVAGVLCDSVKVNVFCDAGRQARPDLYFNNDKHFETAVSNLLMCKRSMMVDLLQSAETPSSFRKMQQKLLPFGLSPFSGFWRCLAKDFCAGAFIAIDMDGNLSKWRPLSVGQEDKQSAEPVLYTKRHLTVLRERTADGSCVDYIVNLSEAGSCLLVRTAQGEQWRLSRVDSDDTSSMQGCWCDPSFKNGAPIVLLNDEAGGPTVRWDVLAETGTPAPSAMRTVPSACELVEMLPHTSRLLTYYVTTEGNSTDVLSVDSSNGKSHWTLARTGAAVTQIQEVHRKGRERSYYVLLEEDKLVVVTTDNSQRWTLECVDAASERHVERAPPPPLLPDPSQAAKVVSQNYPRYRWTVINSETVKIAKGEGSGLRIVPGLTGEAGTVSFEAVELPGHYLRSKSATGITGKYHQLCCHQPASVRHTESTFRLHAALNREEGALSFESVALPGHFIGHRGFVLYVVRSNDSSLHRNDASFTWHALGTCEAAVVVAKQEAVRMEEASVQALTARQDVVKLISHNYPQHRWTVINSETVKIAKGEGSGLRIVPGLVGEAGTVSFEVVELPGHYLRHQAARSLFISSLVQSRMLRCEPYNANTDDSYQADASFWPRAARADGLRGEDGYISFESVSTPGRYIAHRYFYLGIATGMDSKLHCDDASFMVMHD